ncbi:hypothetical protein CP061683_2005 [Chlamydia psittaci 06-1683]|nr:hypothetical protein CP061683_2005 [Chlamydia psittaci 06-1683]
MIFSIISAEGCNTTFLQHRLNMSHMSLVPKEGFSLLTGQKKGRESRKGL